jgi:tellurite resistance protein
MVPANLQRSACSPTNYSLPVAVPPSTVSEPGVQLSLNRALWQYCSTTSCSVGAPGRTEKLTKKDAVSLASLLAKFNIGIEPDVRFGGKTPTPGSTAVVFILPDQAPAAPSAPYAAAAALVHLTAVVASSDGSIDDGERLHLARHLEASLELDGPERARLNAHFTWLTVGKPSLTGVKTKVNALSVAQRSAIGLFLVDLAAADGVVSPEEITTLTKLYKLLGIDESELYRTVHTLGTDTDTGPLTVRTADYDAPPPCHPAPDPAGTGIRLDPAKVQARMAETATVTALLADIFTEEDPPGRSGAVSAFTR